MFCLDCFSFQSVFKVNIYFIVRSRDTLLSFQKYPNYQNKHDTQEASLIIMIMRMIIIIIIIIINLINMTHKKKA